MPGSITMSRRLLAEELDVSVRTVARWTEQGVLPQPVKIGGVVLYRRADVEEKVAAWERPSVDELKPQNDWSAR